MRLKDNVFQIYFAAVVRCSGRSETSAKWWLNNLDASETYDMHYSYL